MRFRALILIPMLLSCNKPTVYQFAAVDTANWIRSTIDDSLGIWPNDALSFPTASLDIGAGAAGKILFYVQFCRSTKHTEFLDEAIRGGKYVTARMDLLDSIKFPSASIFYYPV